VSNEIQQAAERVRRFKRGGGIESASDIWPNFDDTDLGRRIDYATLATAYLAEHPADSDEPIDEAWLASVQEGLCPRQFGMRTAVQVRQHEGKWMACIAQSDYASETPLEEMDADEVSQVAIEVKTRGDVRRLAAVLGASLKE
jgi:hypothetical protein